MFSKQQASQIRQEFWTVFGKYMQPVASAEGGKINWINYRTGAKHINFKMDAGKGARIAIELSHPDPATREQHWQKLLQLKSVFVATLREDWHWQPLAEAEGGRPLSLVFTRLENVHVFNKADWPAMISFFKPRIIALDLFWSQVKHEFDVW